MTKCRQCGTEFEPKLSVWQRGCQKRAYCTAKCRYDGHKERETATNRARYAELRALGAGAALAGRSLTRTRFEALKAALTEQKQ